MFMSWITLRPPLSIDKVNYSYSLHFFEHIFATTYLHNDTEKIRITEIQTSLWELIFKIFQRGFKIVVVIADDKLRSDKWPREKLVAFKVIYTHLM